MKELTIGVIGAGRIGKIHIDNITKHFPYIRIKSIADPGSSGYLQDPQVIVDDNEIQAVLICSPVDFHVPQIIACARKGKHIFCEKPLATDITQIENALCEVKKAGVKLQVGFNRRFDPNFSRLKQVIVNNEIGVTHLLRITSRDPEIPPIDYLKASSGLFLDMAIHDFDMARFLVNSEIKEIYASGATLIDPVLADFNDIDTAVINLKFENGSLGVIDNSRQAAYGYDQRIEVFGSEGSIAAENNKPTNTVLSNRNGIFTDKPLYFFLERYKEAYLAEMQAFYHAITDDQPTKVSGKDGLLSVVVGLAAQKSFRENRPVQIEYEQWSSVL